MRIFITGASSGLGRGLALHYAATGVTLGLCARRRDMLTELAGEIEQKGGRAIVFAADVADTEAMAMAASDFVVQAGGIDLVIANAGIGIPNGVLQGKSAPIAQLMRINVIGVTNTIVPFIPAMVAQKSGELVAIS